MRVLMYGWEYPPHNSGGLGVACHGLTRGLVAEGADVRFVLPRKYPVVGSGAHMVFADEANPLTSVQADSFANGYMTDDRLRFLRGRYPELQYGPSLFDEVLRYAALSPLVALAHQPDVIHMHDWLCYPAGMAAKRATGAPLVAHVHATEFDRTGFGKVNQAIYEIERRGMYEADVVVTVSDYTKRIVVDRYGIDPNKVVVVHNGIDTDDVAVASTMESDMRRFKGLGWGVVLFVGRLTLQKGPDYFLEAAKKVLSRRANTIFVVSGSGDMAQTIIDRAAYLGIGDRVLFTGFLREKQLARLYGLADLVVMPSVSEPFGIVPLESLLNGTPVLISKQSGVSEVLRNALKVDFWDTDDMANKIAAVLDHPSLRETLSSEGRREASAQTWRKVAERCMMIYRSLVKTVLRV
ncbi:MAG: glycosyltransferase family 4 protein, partial [Candidatus Pacebacteria bacterium]|nr:glycosyltransferase family 4 protein [Candidatus Paceibacterota bacterium]